MAFSEGRGLWEDENIIITISSECWKENKALTPHHIIIKNCNHSMYNKAFLETRKIQIC